MYGSMRFGVYLRSPVWKAFKLGEGEPSKHRVEADVESQDVNDRFRNRPQSKSRTSRREDFKQQPPDQQPAAALED